jgi:putative ABC transport system permease protein
MELVNTARIALIALRRNKVRSALTALGVIIGVASVIAMIALSSGARGAIDAQIQATGTNVVYVSAGSFGRAGGVRQGIGSIQTLTLEDSQALQEQVSTIAHLTPVVHGHVQAITGNENWGTSIDGGNEDYVVVRNWPLASGSNLSPRDVLTADKVCLLGGIVAQNLFPGEDPVGQVIRIKNLPFRVVGVLTRKGQGPTGQDQDDIIVAPYTTLQKKLLGITYLTQIVVSATSPETVETTAVEMTRVLRGRHKIQNPEDDDFTVRTVEEMAQTRVQLAQTMTGLLMSVASVSLLVGGIGIMNIMLVSVTERTKEIGLRMAVGARTRDILGQFLTEAVTLSAFGGIVGIAVGVGVSRGLTAVLGWPTQVTPVSVALAFVFSGAVGVFFGYYPARKAASLDPIDALHYE